MISQCSFVLSLDSPWKMALVNKGITYPFPFLQVAGRAPSTVNPDTIMLRLEAQQIPAS